MITEFKLFLNEGRVPTSERIKLIDNDEYLLVVPLSDKASCKYGAFTKWCTAVPYSGASIEDANVNKEGYGNKILYLLNKKYDKNTDIADKFSYMYKNLEDGEISIDEYEDFVETIEDEFDRFDLSKIAFEFNSKTKNYLIWDKNNIEMTTLGYSLYDLELDDYVIETLIKYCENND